MAYLGKTPSQAVRSRYYFTASGSETSLSPSEVTGLSFTDANYVDVSLNGVALVSGTDYTATPSTNTISGLAALTASDVVEIVVYDTFSVFGGSVNGDFTISNGTLAAEAVTVTGLTTTGDINFGDNDKAVFGAGSDLQIFHDGSNSIVKDAGTGILKIQGSGQVTIEDTAGNVGAAFNANTDVALKYAGSNKLVTTSTGIDVTGTVTAADQATGAPVLENRSGDRSAGSPQFTFKNNTGTGMRRASSNVLAFDTGGTQRVNISGIGDISFYDSTGTTQGLFWDASTQRLGLGITDPADKLQVANTSGSVSVALEANTTGTSSIKLGDTANTAAGEVVYDNSNNSLSLKTAATERMRIDSSGVVGIGVVPSGTAKLQVNGQIYASSDGSASAPAFAVNDGDTGMFRPANNNLAFTTGGSEAARFDSSGRLLVGTTDTALYNNTSGNGFIYDAVGGSTQMLRDGGAPLLINRAGSDGELIRLYSQGGYDGGIGIMNDGYVQGLYIGTGDTALGFQTAVDDSITPANSNTGLKRDNAIDLGSSAARFDDIFATNGTIQTSDQNEKNTITDSDLGLDFINRLEPKSYVFNGKTRTHYGLIAQDVETVLGDISKPTSGFAGFIKSDISEEQDNSEYRYGLRYTEFVGPLIQAVKDLKAELDAAKARIETLENA